MGQEFELPQLVEENYLRIDASGLPDKSHVK